MKSYEYYSKHIFHKSNFIVQDKKLFKRIAKCLSLYVCFMLSNTNKKGEYKI